MSHDSHSQAVALEAAFTDHQWQEFRKEDVKAGGAVVMLMLAIFSIGVILYTIVNLAIVM